jgi:hypothetical protein
VQLILATACGLLGEVGVGRTNQSAPSKLSPITMPRSRQIFHVQSGVDVIASTLTVRELT